MTSPITITICVGSSCYVRGSERLGEIFQSLIESEGLRQALPDAQVETTGAFCMEQCSMGVSVKVGNQVYRGVTVEAAKSFFYQEIMPKITAEVAR